MCCEEEKELLWHPMPNKFLKEKFFWTWEALPTSVSKGKDMISTIVTWFSITMLGRLEVWILTLMEKLVDQVLIANKFFNTWLKSGQINKGLHYKDNRLKFCWVNLTIISVIWKLKTNLQHTIDFWPNKYFRQSNRSLRLKINQLSQKITAK